MKTPYLIQRGRFQNREGKTGIDAIVLWDYMGAAEFEFGALGKSLQRMRENADKYASFSHEIKTVVSPSHSSYSNITVYSPSADCDKVKQYINQLADDKIRCKCFTDLKSWINPSDWDKRFIKTNGGHATDFWWDIDNDFMFWKRSAEMDAKVIAAVKENLK